MYKKTLGYSARFAAILSTGLAVAGVLSVTATPANAIGILDTETYNGHTYYLLTESSWQDAEAEAISLGGHLATINDAAEQTWVFSTFGSFGGVDRSLWIGLNDVVSSRNFVWASGEPVTYTDWYPGQPDLVNEHYVHMIRTGNGFGVAPGFWNNLESPNSPFTQFDPLSGVVEVAEASIPEPETYALMLAGLGLLGFAARRRKPNSVRG